MRRPLSLLLVSALIVSCSGDDKNTDSSATVSTDATTAPSTAAPTTVAETTTPSTTEPPVSTLPAEQVAQLVAERPYNMFVPSAYDPAAAMPLVVVLHGFTLNSQIQEDYFHFEALADQLGFLYARPDGTPNERGELFWNATPACCANGTDVDDSRYVQAIIDDVKASYTVDPKQVYLVGFSNGAFMSYRMACDHADTIAAIVSISGATFLNAGDCAPAEPVSVLEMHGDVDTIIRYDGGTFQEPNPYPSALQTVEMWSTYNKCTGAGESHPDALDLDVAVEGNETSTLSFAPCAADTVVELWTMSFVGHGPQPTAILSPTIIEFLFAHPKA